MQEWARFTVLVLVLVLEDLRMKRLITAVCCACVIGIAGVSAAQADKMDKAKMDKDAKSMSVTGCVAEKDGHYMLNNAMVAGDTTAMTYDLKGGSLKAHVGHKVKVMGAMDSKMKMDKDKMDKNKMESSGTINVKSVTMISSTCL